MSEHPTAATVVCTEYQRLLEDSARTRKAWNEFRVEICLAQLIPKKAVDNLHRLQAKYARACKLLEKHAHTCGRCELAPRIA